MCLFIRRENILMISKQNLGNSSHTKEIFRLFYFYFSVSHWFFLLRIKAKCFENILFANVIEECSMQCSSTVETKITIEINIDDKDFSRNKQNPSKCFKFNGITNYSLPFDANEIAVLFSLFPICHWPNGLLIVHLTNVLLIKFIRKIN